MKTVVKDKNLFKITDSLFEAIQKNGDIILREANQDDAYNTLLNNYVLHKNILINDGYNKHDFSMEITQLLKILLSLRSYLTSIENNYYTKLFDKNTDAINVLFYTTYSVESFKKILYDAKKETLDKSKKDSEIKGRDISKLFDVTAEETYNEYSEKTYPVIEGFLVYLEEIINGFQFGNTPYDLSGYDELIEIANINSSEYFNKIIGSKLAENIIKFENDKKILDMHKKGVSSANRKKESDKTEKKIDDIEIKVYIELMNNDRELNYRNWILRVKSGLSSIGIYYGIHYIFLTSNNMNLSDLPSENDIKDKYEELKGEIESDYENKIMDEEKYKQSLDQIDNDYKEMIDTLDVISDDVIFGQKQLSKISEIFGEMINKKFLELASKSSEKETGSDNDDNAYKLYILVYDREKYNAINEFLTTDVKLRKIYDIKRRSIPTMFNIPYNKYTVDFTDKYLEDFDKRIYITNIKNKFDGNYNSKYDELNNLFNEKYKVSLEDYQKDKSKYEKIDGIENDFNEIKKELNSINDSYDDIRKNLFENVKTVCLTGVTLYSDLFKKIFSKKAFNDLKDIISILTKRNKGIDW